MDKPRIVAWFVGDEVADDDPLAAVKHRARQLCDPHYMAARSADRLDEVTGLFADPVFNPLDVGDAASAAGMSEDDLDAASYVALLLRQVETSGDQLP